MKFIVTAASVDRKTRERKSDLKDETIDTEENEQLLLSKWSEYEAFWAMNPRSENIVKVIGVKVI